jgi:hypothetical protein
VDTFSWSFLLWIALALALFGALAFWRLSKRGTRQQAVAFVIGIPGVYLCLVSEWKDIHLLLIPGVVILLAGSIVQYRANKKAPGTVVPRQSILSMIRQSKGAPAERRYDEW